MKWATIDNLPALTMEIWSDNPFVKKHVQEALDRLQNEADPETRKAISDAIIHGRDLARSETIPRALKTAKEGDPQRASARPETREGTGGYRTSRKPWCSR